MLEAAERLWTGGDRAFELLFLGWSGWLGEEFDDLVKKLVAGGRPIIVRKHCSEEELWGAYRLARFTVFRLSSRATAYRSPILSIRYSGDHVELRQYGRGGGRGCLLVDPRDVDELERAMALLLGRRRVLGKLSDEGERRTPAHGKAMRATSGTLFTETASTRGLRPAVRGDHPGRLDVLRRWLAHWIDRLALHPGSDLVEGAVGRVVARRAGTSHRPLVTYVTMVRNNAGTLHRAIESVQRQHTSWSST